MQIHIYKCGAATRNDIAHFAEQGSTTITLASSEV